MALLRWAGSKTRLLGELEKRLPSDYSRRDHVEPFAGSAALFFHMRPAEAVLSDVCLPLINFYRQLASRHDLLHAFCCSLAASFARDPKSAYDRAKRGQTDPSELISASCFWLVNQTCFNGIWRENSKGEMNVPIGSRRQLPAPELAAFTAASLALRGCQVLHQTVWRCNLYPDTDFAYADPPYDAGFTQYSAGGWKPVDLRDLRSKLVSFGGPWMLSNADTPFVREMFDGFRIEKVTVHRSMRPNGKRTADELIIRNY